MIVFLIWLMSCLWAMCFISWMVDKDTDTILAAFVCLCPIFNTVFAAYRTYRHFKNGNGIKFLKDLFAE